MKVRRSSLKDTVTVQTRSGGGSYGDTLSPVVTVPCSVDETRRIVRNSAGQEAVSEATLTLHPRTKAKAVDNSVTIVDPMTLFTTGSEVMIGTRASEVLAAKENTLRDSVVSVEVTCA